MEPRAGPWTRRRARASESSQSQDATGASVPPPTEKEKTDKGATQPPTSPDSHALPVAAAKDASVRAPPGKKKRTSAGTAAEDVAEVLPSSAHATQAPASDASEPTATVSLDDTETASSAVQASQARIKVNPISGGGRSAAKIITQEEEDDFNQRSTTHDDHLVPEGFVSVGGSAEALAAFEAEVHNAEGPLCIGVLYRFDMTNFRKGEVMGNYFQRPNLLDVILGVAILQAKHKGRPAYLPLFDDEATTGVSRRRKWAVFLSILGAERSSEPRRDHPVKEVDKIVYGAQELLKHVMRHNTDAHPRHLFDPAIAAWLLDSELASFEFPALLQHFLPSLVAAEEKERSDYHATHVSQPKDKRANARMLFKDMLQCMQLATLLRPRLDGAEVTTSLKDIEMPITPLLAKMENTGLVVDVELLKHYRQQLNEHLTYLRRESRNLVGEEVDLASPQKLSDLLFTTLRMRPPIESSSPRPSVSEAVLKQLSLASQHGILPVIIDFRHCQKLLTAYVYALLSKTISANGQSLIYPIWHHTGTATGRLSASEPAIQNLPRVPYALKRPDFFGPGGETKINVRDAIIARPNHVFIAADYMQLEARVLAHFSQDPFLLSFLASGRDLHRLVASRMKGKAEEEVTEEERETAKHIVYGILYGIGPTSLSEILQVPPEQAKAYIDEFLSRFPLVKAFLGAAVAEAKDNQAVRTAFGRRRLLPNIMSQNAAESNKAERQAVNSKVQGTAADIAKLAMLRVEEALRSEGKSQARLVMQIHDELVYEVPEPGLNACAAIIRSHMETQLGGVALPVRVYCGARFGSLRPWRLDDAAHAQPSPATQAKAHTTVSAGGSM